MTKEDDRRCRKNESKVDTNTFNKDTITRVMGCATMWHESKPEMCEMLKSIFRIDEDYSSR